MHRYLGLLCFMTVVHGRVREEPVEITTDGSKGDIMYICLCKGIRGAEFEDIVVRNDGHAEWVKRAMGLDESCCGRCEGSLEDMIQEIGFARCLRT